MQKIKIGHRAKFRDKDNFFPAGFISVSRDFTPYFHFRCVARATFDRNLIHCADACLLVMACVGYSRAQLKTLSSLLKPWLHERFFARAGDAIFSNFVASRARDQNRTCSHP